MLANNVQELTTTNGVGNITLAGSSAYGKTFTSQFSLSERFSYVIDDGAGNWENGVGYLSNASTLVRELPLDGSASLPVNFSAGSKEVFNAITAQVNNPANTNKPTLLGTDYLCSTHAAANGTNVTLTVGRLYYVPFVLEYSGGITSIGIKGNAGVAGTCQVAIYSVGTDGMPADKILSGTLDTGLGGNLQASTGRSLPTGTYWAAILSTAGLTTRGVYWIYSKPLGMTGFNYELRPNGGLIADGQDGLVVLPDIAISPTATYAGSVPALTLGVA